MKTLVWVEHDGAAVKDATLSAVTAASKLGEVHLLVAGLGVGAVADAAAKIAGVGKVHVADDAAYAHARWLLASQYNCWVHISRKPLDRTF